MANTIRVNPNAARTGIIAAVILILLVMAAGCMTKSLSSGEAGVKYSSFSGTDLGASYGEGLNVFFPWERMIVYDVRTKTATEPITALSSNGLTIGMDISVRYEPRVTQLPFLHTTFGPEYYERLIQPEIRSAAREVVGRYTPEELYSSRRTELQLEIEQRVTEAVQDQFVDIEAILIRDVTLPDQIRRAIETKLEEEQRVQQIEATGQAEYQRIITQSLTPQFLRFQGIEATRELAESDNAKVVVIGSGGDGLPIILGNQ
ncbi:MAG: prohibitin family protein [Rhodothermaceae bacterium]|nr:prohibitin family protein [Rhodothermaceae bacterium]